MNKQLITQKHKLHNRNDHSRKFNGELGYPGACSFDMLAYLFPWIKTPIPIKWTRKGDFMRKFEIGYLDLVLHMLH